METDWLLDETGKYDRIVGIIQDYWPTGTT
jgi:hypothetical protein